MNEENSTKFNGYFEVDESYESDVWIRTKIRTFAFGKNRNGSDIINSSMSNFNKAHKTIGGIPIVAKYNDEIDDLEGHNVTLRQNKDGEYEFHHDTTPLGFTSPFSTFYTEEVNEGTELSPDYKTYIVVDDVYLWKRYDATKKILEWKSKGFPAKVSMEIDQVEGSFDKDGYFAINDFIFTAICALGSDIEPCFPKAEIQLYTANDFKADLKQLMYELTAQGETELKGGKKVEQNTNQEFETTVETEVESQESTENVETTEDVTVETEVTNEQEVTEEFTEETQSETTEVEETVEESTEESVEEVKEEVSEEFETTTEEVQIEETTVESVEAEEVVEETVNEFEVKYNNLAEEFEVVKTELEELRAFKRKTEEAELSAQFEGQLTSDELAQVFEQSKESSIQDIKKELYALVGKKNFSLMNEKPVTKIAVDVNKETKQFSNSPYGDLFEKHLDKVLHNK